MLCIISKSSIRATRPLSIFILKTLNSTVDACLPASIPESLGRSTICCGNKPYAVSVLPYRMHVSIILCLGIVRRFQPPLTSYILQNISFIILHTLSPHKRISHSNGVKLMKTQILLSYIHYTFMEDIDFISAHPPRADFLRKRKYDREFKILTAETSRRDRGQKPIKSFASKTLRFDAR